MSLIFHTHPMTANKFLNPVLKMCSWENCNTAIEARGFCSRHRNRWRYYNNPVAIERRRQKKLLREQTPEWIAWNKDVERRKAEKAVQGEAIKKRLNDPDRFLRKRYTMAIYECKKRKKLHFQWLISFDDFKMLCAQPCWYCGGALGSVKFGKGLDRIDSKGDYTLNNVYPCCNTCNRIKGHDLTAGEVKRMVQVLLFIRKQENAKA